MAQMTVSGGGSGGGSAHASGAGGQQPNHNVRRPFLQITVLFGSDPKVMAYARNVQHKFFDAGVDVFVKSKLEGEVPGIDAKQALFIKPEHLVNVITHTNADYLIVIGDRNMKNDTCQARRSGKLVEMKVEERIRLLLVDWGEVSGLRPAAAMADCMANGANLTHEQLSERLKRHTGVGHVDERTRRLQLSVNELSEWKRPRKLSEQDADIIAKLTKAQNAAIKFHRELSGAQDIVTNIGTIPTGGQSGASGGGGSGGAASALKQLNLGLG
eukprot:g3651.t1